MKIRTDLISLSRTLYLTAFCLVVAVIAGFFTFMQFLSMKQMQDWLPVEAVISDLSADAFGEPAATVTYSFNGETYTGISPSYSSSYKLGQTLKLYANPDNPAQLGSRSLIFLIFPALICVGCCCVAAFLLIQHFKKRRMRAEEEAQWASAPQDDGFYTPSDIAEADGEMQTYYFRSDVNTAKPGYYLENAAHQVLLEAKCTKFSLIGDAQYEFVNHLSLQTVTRSLGHVTSTTTGSITSDADFTVDGISIHEVLRQNGIRLQPEIQHKPLRVIYTVSRYGKPYAKVTSTGKDPHGDLKFISVPGFYRLETAQSELDLPFLLLVTFARTGSCFEI